MTNDELENLMKFIVERQRGKATICRLANRLLDFETADGINRTLSNALRDLETV